MIFHITTEVQWTAALATGSYHVESLESEGFIHCSTQHQLQESANKYFQGQKELLILYINEEKVSAPIIFEDSYGTGQSFPHIYGELNLDAVMNVIPFPVRSNCVNKNGPIKKKQVYLATNFHREPSH